MKKLIFLLMCGSLFAQASPCEDKSYLELKKKNLDEMSDREYQYFLSKDTQCNEYLSSNKNLKSTLSSDRTNSLRTRKLFDISTLISVYGLTILGDILVDNGLDIPLIVIPVIGPFLAFIPSDEYDIEGYEIVLLLSGFVQTGFLIDFINTSKKINKLNNNISYQINPNPIAPSVKFTYNFD